MGIGKTMLQKVCDECIEKGMDRLSLHVAVGNENAIGFYIKNGFETVCKEDNGTLRMCKILDEQKEKVNNDRTAGKI